MRGLLSVLAGISGSKQFCELTRSSGGLGGFAGVGRVGLGGSNTDETNVHFVFRFMDLLIRLFLFSCFYIHRGITYL